MAIIGPRGGRGSVSGLQSLQKKLLKTLPAAAKARAKQALAENADELVDLQKSLAPIGPPSGQQRRKGAKPGALKDSITATFGGDAPAYAAFQSGARRKNRHKMGTDGGDPDLRVVVTAGNSRVRYAHMVEFGTAPHVNKGKFAGTQHPGTNAQPFFFPAYRALRKRMKNRVARAIKKAMKEGSV